MHVNVDTNISYPISALQTHDVESAGHGKEDVNEVVKTLLLCTYCDMA